jgi:kinetochore protein Mis12/MTW1
MLQSLLDDIINAVNILAESALKSIEQGLLNYPPASLGFREPPKSRRNAASEAGWSRHEPDSLEEASKFEIDNGTHQLETLLCSSIDKNFDIFELYVMRNILCVRPEDRDWMRLAHYNGLDFTKTADAPDMESVNALRRRLRASQRLNSMLHTEKARNDALLSKLRTLVGTKASRASLSGALKVEPEAAKAPFAFLHDKGALPEGDAETPIQTTTAFTLSQLQALRSLSSSLRSMMPDLTGGKAQGVGASDGWRRERVEYVEGATRKHLENIRGLELGRQGEIRDGEWQGGGRKFTRAEVEGLEKAISILGRTESKDEMDES